MRRVIFSSKPCLLLTLALFLVLSCAGPSVSQVDFQPCSTALPDAKFKLQDTMIPTADGQSLAATVLLPEGKTGPLPSILVITPYGKLQGGGEGTLASLRGENPEATLFATTDYAFVYVDRRGRFDSRKATPRKDSLNPFGADGYDCVEWIASQPWSNGKVGTWGASALGNAQYQLAVEKPPHLTCIVPIVADPLGGYQKSFPGGILRQEWAENNDRIGWGEVYAKAKAHPLDDGAYNPTAERTKDIEVPVLAIGGWFDINEITGLYNILRTNSGEKTRQYHRLVMGPWTHQGHMKDVKQGEVDFPNAGAFAREQARQFYDYWLRGIGDARNPPVYFYQLGVNQWYKSESWPPAGAKETAFYLDNSGKLDLKAVSGTQPKTLLSDPANPVPSVGGNLFNPALGGGFADQAPKVETHKDVLIYSTDVLNEDVMVDGSIKLRLFVASDYEDSDIVYRLTDVYPDGRSMLLREGPLRLSLRETFKEYRWLKPGEVYEVNIPADPVANTFQKGHRIRLILASSSFPHYAVNNNQTDKTAPPKSAKNLIYADNAHPSALYLPVVKK